MSDFIKSQMDARNNLIAQAREVLDFAEAEKRGLSAEENQKIARIEADIDSADTAIETARKIADREARASEAAASFTPTPAARSTNDADLIRSIAQGELRSHEFRAALTPTSGSGVVPYTFYDRVFEILKNTNPLFETSTLITTDGGNSLQIPQVTAYSTATIKSAGSAIDESNPTLASINLGAFKYSFLVNLSNELIQDSGVDLLGLIADISGREMAFDVGNGLTNGTGTVQPTGIVTAAGSAVTGGTGVSGAPTYENLVDLAYSVAGNNRSSYGWNMNSTGLAAIRKIKDGAGNYIFTPSASVDGRDLLLGTRIYENPSMPDVAVGAKSIIYGKLDDFVVRQAGGIQVATSTDYAFNSDVTTFRVLWRGDSNLAATGSIKYFKGGAS
jgi:HK97 family phage major capsid protein